MAEISNIDEAGELSRFASGEWEKALAFLQSQFSIPEDDCKDIFQESFIILYLNIREGRLEGLTASLSTYFLSICRNKALEFLRKSKRTVGMDKEIPLTLLDGEIRNDRVEALLSLDCRDERMEAEKEELVRDIVRNLPSPCKELLWGYYRDNLSMKALARILNYKSENVAKVTKHRCCEKFRARYNELCHKLF